MKAEASLENKQPLVILAGPTAVGKSALALAAAPLLHAEIICADSAQIYRRLDIGTAKPTAEEKQKVAHHLVDMVEPDRDFSVADYQKEAYRRIEEIAAQKRIPLLVGGTGLYINAVIDRYAFGKRGKSSALRDKLELEAAAHGTEALHRRLSKVDPVSAKVIHPRDRRRIIRALEVYYQEGVPISSQVERTRRKQSRYNLCYFAIQMPRPELYRRIEKRVDTMINQGFIDEVKGLLEEGYSPSSPGLQILGYRQLVNYLQGRIALDSAIAEIKQHTRNLAKRQLTWFRRDSRIVWLDAGGDTGLESLAEIIYSKVKEILPLQTNNILQANDWREPSR